MLKIPAVKLLVLKLRRKVLNGIWQISTSNFKSSSRLTSALRTWVAKSKANFLVSRLRRSISHMRWSRTRLCSRSNVDLLMGYIRCSLTGQNKPSTLGKVQRLENLGRIGVSRLQTKASKVSQMERCNWCQRPTEMIAIGLKELIQTHDTNVIWRWWMLFKVRRYSLLEAWHSYTHNTFVTASFRYLCGHVRI